MRIEIRIRPARLRAPSLLGAMVVVIALAGSRVKSRAGEPPAGPASGPPVARAATLFAQRCARCHEEDGTGTALRRSIPTLPNFADPRWQQHRRDAQLVVSILDGKGTQMPAFGGRLTKAEARALAVHIRGLSPQQMVGMQDMTPPDFQERFRELQEEFERLRKQFHDLRAHSD